jgi:chloramphenicol-sensitive protein RarD
LLPLAFGLLFWVSRDGHVAFGSSLNASLLLICAGPVTALPLMFFAFGARRISFAALGMFQFLAPSIQFALGLWFGEPFHPWSVAAFTLIWIGLGFFCWDMWTRYAPKEA